MHADTLTFLDTLFRRCQTNYPSACLTLTAIHPDHRHPTPSRHIHQNHHPALTEALEQLKEANIRGWGAYFAVGLRKSGLSRWRRGGAAEVVALPAFYIDVDDPTDTTLTRLRTDRLPPSIIVHSGGGYHAYWLLDEPTTYLEQARQVLQGLARRFGGDALSPAQSLRLPGTMNTKPERNGALCHRVECSDRYYRLSDFQRFIQPVSSRSTPRSAVLTTACIANRHLNPQLIQAVTTALYSDFEAHEQRQSAWLAALCPCGHTRDSPGKHFFWNPAIGCGHCHGRHGTLRLTHLCSILGINAADYGGIYT